MDINYELNYYNILNITKEFTPDDLKREYRILSKKYHPDISTEENADIIFKQIIIGYKVLGKPELREKYDNTSRHGRFYKDTNELFDFEFSNINKEKAVYNESIDKFKKNDLLHIVIEMENFQELITYDRHLNCGHCNGSGKDMDTANYECAMCDGSGKSLVDGKKCEPCDGGGYIGIKNCGKCGGERRITKKETIKISQSMFTTDNKLKFDYKGNHSKYESGKVGHLYIIWKGFVSPS